jgi:hypothetical protein
MSKRRQNSIAPNTLFLTVKRGGSFNSQDEIVIDISIEYFNSPLGIFPVYKVEKTTNKMVTFHPQILHTIRTAPYWN